ncbi:metallophosphoesterase [Paenibacillus sp. GD4]|uniref:metallophosphoesterase n=1 Tax=Paenibacillus sp. GD4 TaxID=3068890 RepID=UPI002796851E|nr:metallophosphoesterase [Paenibacillus sp. GD4]MDQ1913745.1 metallophosphoesterase [Paenibacillus sp. GD4]
MKGITGMVFIMFLIFFVFFTIQTLWVKCSIHKLETSSRVSLTVVQLSDLHGRIQFINGSLSSIVNKVNPDYVFITGDLVSKKSQIYNVLREIRKLNCPNIYFVPGNYEREGLVGFRKKLYSDEEYSFILRSLQEQNVSVLSNSGTQLETNQGKFLLYGFDNSIYGNERLTLNIEELNYDYFIMLAHSPNIINFIEEKKLPYDLLLVGHTHGGQIRFLNRTIGAYKNYHVGLRKLDQRRNFYINRGLGTVKIPIRMACFPEIAVFKIGF